MINQKGGLAQSAEEIKTKAKQDIAAPADFNEMLFQLEAFVALSGIVFGNKSIAATKLGKFARLINANGIIYKQEWHWMIGSQARYFGWCAPASNCF
jgi:hypothetical protein